MAKSKVFVSGVFVAASWWKGLKLCRAVAYCSSQQGVILKCNIN
jgi:hypothetical protein